LTFSLVFTELYLKRSYFEYEIGAFYVYGWQLNGKKTSLQKWMRKNNPNAHSIERTSLEDSNTVIDCDTLLMRMANHQTTVGKVTRELYDI